MPLTARFQNSLDLLATQAREIEGKAHELFEEHAPKVAATVATELRRIKTLNPVADRLDDLFAKQTSELPIAAYDTLTVPEITAQLASLNKADLERIKTFEEANKARKTLLREVERLLA